MAEHTDGEWMVVGDYVYARIENDDDNPDDIEIARVTRPADACLIAAAPDLLAACEAALERENQRDTPAFSSLRAQLRAALAKARGTTDD